MRRILAVSTERRLLDVLAHNLLRCDFVIETLTDTDILFEAIASYQPDLLLVDFILQHENGGAICHQVKCNPLTRDLPVILLSEYDGLDRFANKFGSCAIVKRSALFPALVDEIQQVFEGKAA
jgi:DNA-binding response OmpR family regulator